MLIALALPMLLAALWLLGAAVLAAWRRISFHQALFLLPPAIVHRMGYPSRAAVEAEPPVIYAILHQSRLDPALMLSLLPEDTLHILDEVSARSPWLEPWRAMARTIAFNPRHVFVSRRFVLHLKRRGRLAVYFPAGIDPETRAYRLYRAVAKIAAAGGARIVAISVRGSNETAFSLAAGGRRRVFARLRVRALEPLTMQELVGRSRREQATMARALYDRVAEADAA